jgi:hypothetical protein
MTTPLRDALTQRINQVGPAHPDLEELVGLGEQRLRRRRLAAVAGTGAAVVLAIALAIGGTAWNRSAENSGPIDRPPKHPRQTQTITRPIVYSDDVEYRSGTGDAPGVSIHVGTVHVGDQEVDIDQTGHRGWALWVTDAGVVYSNGDGLWFTDGGAPRQAAAPACRAESGSSGPPAMASSGSLAMGSSGALAIWICEGDLVVFDIASDEEVARKPLPSCRDKRWACIPYDVVGEHAYFIRYGVRGSTPELLYRFDVSTGRVVAATDQMYADDLRANSRALVVGDSWRTGTATTEVEFNVSGSRLVPTGPTKAFDAATGKPVSLRLPSDYAPGPLPDYKGGTIPGSSTSFHLFEWLDNDTVALVQGDYFFGDILTCHLSDGRCRLAVPAGPPDQIRMVPGRQFP